MPEHPDLEAFDSMVTATLALHEALRRVTEAAAGGSWDVSRDNGLTLRALYVAAMNFPPGTEIETLGRALGTAAGRLQRALADDADIEEARQGMAVVIAQLFAAARVD